jgi:hypothetical protein
MRCSVLAGKMNNDQPGVKKNDGGVTNLNFGKDSGILTQ